MAAISTFKISQLDAISSVSNEDLFLVSDYEGGECLSRKMSVGQLMEQVAQDPGLSVYVQDRNTPLGRAIYDSVARGISADIVRQLSAHFEQSVIDVISVNYETVWDLLDNGKTDKQMIIGQ